MKNKLLIIVFLLNIISINIFSQSEDALVKACASAAGDDATYLKDFIVKLDAAAPGEKYPTAKYSMVLSKNTEYRFSICTAPDSQGKGIIQLFDTNRLLGSSFNAATGKEYPGFNFKCQKTGVYHVFISFQEGKSGRAVGILSFVQKL
jgi:hypothetical protein